MDVEHHPVFARLNAAVRADWVLRHVGGDARLWAGNTKVIPSGLDVIASEVARTVIASPRSVALAVPRGRSPLPVMLGMYLTISRVIIGQRTSAICGSVAVSTTRTELRDLGH